MAVHITASPTTLRNTLSQAYSSLHAHQVLGRGAMENMANLNTIDKDNPYQKTKTSFRAVVDKTTGKPSIKPQTHKVQTKYLNRYEPDHPMADDNGFIKVPDIDAYMELSELNNSTQASKLIAKGIEIITSGAKRVLQLIGT